jgi:hypothetical protein
MLFSIHFAAGQIGLLHQLSLLTRKLEHAFAGPLLLRLIQELRDVHKTERLCKTRTAVRYRLEKLTMAHLLTDVSSCSLHCCDETFLEPQQFGAL